MKKTSLENIEVYKKQMELGIIPKVYRAIIEYMMQLRNDFSKKHSEFTVGSFYQGYMDMTYFPLVSNELKNKKLKLAIVFNHLEMQFEIWLSAQNRNIKQEYLEKIQQKKLPDNYLFTDNPDSIVEMIVLKDPDFSNLNQITTAIETGVKTFTKDVMEIIK